MLKTSKFWFPFIVSLLIMFGLIFVSLAGAGTHTRTGPFGESVGLFLFPYASALMNFLSTSKRVPDSFIILGIILFLGQYPIYGLLIGYANAKGRLKSMLYWILGVHVVFYAIAYLTKAPTSL